MEGTNEVLIPGLHSGEIDMVVGRLTSLRHRAKIVQEKLFDETVLAVVGPDHPLAGSIPLNLRAIAWNLAASEDCEATMNSYPDLCLCIDGTWRKTPETLPVLNPATEQEIGRLPIARLADRDDALAAAEAGVRV